MSKKLEARFCLGQRVEKVSGSQWRGLIVGTYSTDLTAEGYAVESDTERGSVQIYPAKALRLVTPANGEQVELAHELWALAQLGPCEGIEDGVARITQHLPTPTQDARERVKVLEEALEAVRRQIGLKDHALHEKNVALDALGWVWCDGGCPRGVGRFNDIEVTEEMVAKVERNAVRLRTWFANREYRARAALGNQEERL